MGGHDELKSLKTHGVPLVEPASVPLSFAPHANSGRNHPERSNTSSDPYVDQNENCFDVFALQLSRLAVLTSQDIDDPPRETWPLSTAATSMVPWLHPVKNGRHGRVPMFKQTIYYVFF